MVTLIVDARTSDVAAQKYFIETGRQTLDAVLQLQSQSRLNMSSPLKAIGDTQSTLPTRAPVPPPRAAVDPDDKINLASHIRERRMAGDCMTEAEIWDVLRAVVADINLNFTLLRQFSLEPGICFWLIVFSLIL